MDYLVGSKVAPSANSAEPQPALACQNCGHQGQGKFCQECGQSYHTHRITLPHLWHEVFHLFTHLESGFLFTLKELATHPGDMQRQYLAGQRANYQKPFSTFFVAATLLALGQYLIKTAVFKYYGIADESGEYFRHYFALMQIGLLPLYALITWLFFRRSGYNYAEIAVVVLYSLGFMLLGVLLLNALRLIWPHFETQTVELPMLVLYNTLTYFRLFPRTSRWVLAGKSLLINSACFALAAAAETAAVQLVQHH